LTRRAARRVAAPHPENTLITRLMIPVFFCLMTALPVAVQSAAARPPEAEAPPQAQAPSKDVSTGPRTLDFADPRLKATGRDWMAFEAPDKFALMRTMFSFYGLSEETHDIGRAVELLDLMYLSRREGFADGRDKKEVRAAIERDALLNSPVHLNFMYIVNDKESGYGVRYFEKEGAAEEDADGPAGPP